MKRAFGDRLWMDRLAARACLVWVVGLGFTLGGCGPLTFSVGTGPRNQPLGDTVVMREKGAEAKRVAIVDVAGRLINAHTPGLLEQGENPVSLLREKLTRARDDDRVKAVILRLNTPGGGVTASDIMYREVRRFRRQTGKPIVALAMDVTASGGYYLACASDRIVAYPTSVVGSIGVIAQTISLQPGLSRIGIQTEAITSGPMKDTGSLFSQMTDAQRQTLQEMVDDFYRRFLKVVREARPEIPQEKFDRVTDGRVFSGEDAADLGLVDANGDLYDAFASAKYLSGIEAANLVLYHRPLDYVGSPYAATPVSGQASARGHQRSPANASGGGSGTQINLAQINLDGGGADLKLPVGFYYLWQP